MTRLTRGRLTATLTAATLFLAAAVAAGLVVGVTSSDGVRRLELLDLGRALAGVSAGLER